MYYVAAWELDHCQWSSRGSSRTKCHRNVTQHKLESYYALTTLPSRVTSPSNSLVWLYHQEASVEIKLLRNQIELSFHDGMQQEDESMENQSDRPELLSLRLNFWLAWTWWQVICREQTRLPLNANCPTRISLKIIL